MEAMRAYMYLRKSRADTADESIEDTLRRHEGILREFAARQGIAVVGVYKEVVSGDSLYARAQMLKLLEDVEAGEADAVLCMDIDRLGRGSMADQGLIIDTFKAAGVRIVTPRKVYDLNNELDEEYTEFETFLARRELKIIKRRLQRGIRETIQEGGYIANAPYGYVKTTVDRKPTLKINEEEAAFVRILFDMYVNKGMGCQSIADALNRMGAKPHRADAFGLPLSRMFNEGTPLDPDYTSLTYFIRATVPYFWELEKVYDPLQLLDFTGDLLLGNVTLQDMDEAVSLYKQKLIYTPFRHKQRLKESAPYYTTGIRLEYRHGAFHQILREERDVWQAYEAVAELTQRMNDGKLDPIHLNDVIEDFCALKATPF